jgi:uncharacterized protein DUF4340
MAQTLALSQDPRRRNLLFLAGIAAIMVVLAIVALVQQSREVSPHHTARSFLPGLASEVREVARIRIDSKSGSLDVVFKPDRGWIVATHDDYPASFEKVRETLVGLAAMQTIEPKTARPDWLHYLDLTPPPKGDGIEITLQDGHGRTLASVITGKNEDIGDPSGAVGLFVRRANSNQTWLVRSVFTPKTSPIDWLDRQVIDVDTAKIQEADVTPVNGPSYELRRDKPGDPDLKLVNLPQGREIAYPGAADGIAGSISNFTFDDVKPARGFDFSDGHATRLVARTFDGLNVTVQAIKQGQDFWATVSADAAPGKPDAQRQARAVDSRASGWAYKLPQYKGQQIMTTLDSLLKPKAGTSPAK